MTRDRAERRALRHLRAREAELRREALSVGGSANAQLGPDPLRLCALGERLVGLLHGTSELALLDASLNELERTKGPERPVACATFGRNELAVIGSTPEL
ncbi:MAG TPA: hypothetical protein VFQ35_10715, partial [Polyangiaceae bacterium]|nr:hypothetical protein [Polyangiaceae bacterium]